jgi:hypothetical protein
MSEFKPPESVRRRLAERETRPEVEYTEEERELLRKLPEREAHVFRELKERLGAKLVADDEFGRGLVALADPDEPALGKFQREARPTSRAAALALYPRSGSQRRAALEFIAASGARGVTDAEGQAATGIRRFRTRRQELVEGGWVAEKGERRRLATGNMAEVWVLSEAARAELRA